MAILNLNKWTGKIVLGELMPLSGGGGKETILGMINYDSDGEVAITIKADITGLSDEEKVFIIKWGDGSQTSFELKSSAQTITYDYYKLPSILHEIQFSGTFAAITEIEISTAGVTVDLSEFTVFTNAEIIKVVNDVSGITDYEAFGETFINLKELWVDTVNEFNTGWELQITGQDTETQTDGTLVFSATADVVVEVTGDVTLVSTTKEADDAFRSHTVLFNITRNGSGTIRVKEAVKVVSLGNHNGASDPSVDFYTGTNDTSPIVTLQLGKTPRNTQKFYQENYYANILPTTGSIANAPAKLTFLHIKSSNTISGSLADAHADLTYLYITGSNTISGDIANAPADLTYLLITGSNTISGDIADAPADLTVLYIHGFNTINDYTQGKTFANNYRAMRVLGSSGLPQAEMIDLIVDMSAATWGGTPRYFYMISPNASMADTEHTGIWGDFSGTPAPSTLATAYKNLIKTQSVTVSLRGIVVPGVSGDGTGFPAGFGDWYRA